MNGSKVRMDLLTEYDTSDKLGHLFCQEVVAYIERCHLEDGGYFFARIPPSSCLDTYFAVKSLSILEVKPDRPSAIADFFLSNIKEGSLSSLTGIFLTVEVLHELGRMTDELKHYAQQRIMAFQNKAGGFGAYENIDVEVPSELRDTYRAVKVLTTIGADFDREKVENFTLSFLRPDSGYGARGLSTLASTFYATEIHKMLGVKPTKLIPTRDYLRNREKNWQVQFIEDMYWLVLGLVNLGEKTNVPDRVMRFIIECQRSNGGFSRAPVMGIPTLEYTYYALSILREIGFR